MLGYQTASVEIEKEVDIHDPVYNVWRKCITPTLHRIGYPNIPFASGGIRDAYSVMVWDISLPSTNPGYYMVLKMSKNPLTQDELNNRNQVIMQRQCMSYADQFNRCNPPKHVQFAQCQLVKFLDGAWTGKYGTIEPYIGAHFVKHNTANPKLDGIALTLRYTPQAFSHFTYERSGGTEIVVDIQGVGDWYTDPQIYSRNQSYGLADWGLAGINRFFNTHWCNPVCQTLGLKAFQIPPATPTMLSSTTVLYSTYLNQNPPQQTHNYSPAVAPINITSPCQGPHPSVGANPFQQIPYNIAGVVPIATAPNIGIMPLNAMSLPQMTNHPARPPIVNNLFATPYV